MQVPFTYDEAWRNVVNNATVSVDVKALGAVAPVWTSDATVSLTPNETTVITAAASSPFKGALAPTSGDYTLRSGSITCTLTRTSGASTGIVITAGGAGAIIGTMQLRAQPLETAYTVQVGASDPGSVADFGPRSFPDDLPWCGVDDAQAVLSTVVALRAQPLPIITARFLVGNNLIKAGQILGRDLSDRVRVIESETVLNDEFWIESIRHELTGEDDHAVTFGLEAVPASIANLFRFDVVGSGFDDGKFASDIDDPTTLFIFDTDGRGFDDAVLAH
jgi:hypothetical protein